MKPYTKTYMEYFGYQIVDDCFCEVCGRPANDVHHISGRGKGKDVIENLMALCRTHHTMAHEHKLTKDYLSIKHFKFMKLNH